ncbi:MAG: hypothetical protein AAFZ15_17055 [Bacteroidota bacterium]
MLLQTIIKRLAPKKLFLIDGIGALLSAFLLGAIWTRFENIFGMPRSALYILALLPCFFAIYDFICYFKIKENWSPFLKVIAFANLLYCLISIGFLFNHYQQLTVLGLIYFFLELLIVILLAGIELKMAAYWANKKDGGGLDQKT